MKQKVPLALMEQVIMIAVFAVSAALCLEAFAMAERVSRENEDRDNAVRLAQNAAEACIASRGDWDRLTLHLGGTAGEEWTALFARDLKETDDDKEGAYRVVVSREDTACPGLGRAGVCVYGAESGTLLFQLPAAWQEDEMLG